MRSSPVPLAGSCSKSAAWSSSVAVEGRPCLERAALVLGASIVVIVSDASLNVTRACDINTPSPMQAAMLNYLEIYAFRANMHAGFSFPINILAKH
jgi:hypothetical protein